MSLQIASVAGAGVGLLLMGISAVMAVASKWSLGVLAAMGSTRAIHFGEMAVRILIGIVLVWAAPASRCPFAMLAVGAFLIASAAVLIVLPRRWHAAYSFWWSRRIPAIGFRLAGLSGVLAGALLIWLFV